MHIIKILLKPICFIWFLHFKKEGNKKLIFVLSSLHSQLHCKFMMYGMQSYNRSLFVYLVTQAWAGAVPMKDLLMNMKDVTLSPGQISQFTASVFTRSTINVSISGMMVPWRQFVTATMICVTLVTRCLTPGPWHILPSLVLSSSK